MLVFTEGRGGAVLINEHGSIAETVDQLGSFPLLSTIVWLVDKYEVMLAAVYGAPILDRWYLRGSQKVPDANGVKYFVAQEYC